MIKVWDIWVRLFHWSLALLVIFLLFSGETGFQFFDWHRNAGEIVLALLLFRIFWGFLGSSTAKLLPLFKPPKSAIKHLSDLLKSRNAGSTYGHNAAGGYATIALLAVTAIQASTGLFIADEDEFTEGRFYSSVDATVAEWLHEIHHLNAHLLMALVGLHIVMIFFYWAYGRNNLIKPMVTGKAPELSSAGPAPKIQHWWTGLVIAVMSGLMYYLVFVR